MALNLRTAAAN